MDPKNLAESFKTLLRMPKEERLVEWRQVSAEITVLMQETVVVMNKIDLDGNSFTVSTVDLCPLEKGLVLVPQFDHSVMPLALSKVAGEEE